MSAEDNRAIVRRWIDALNSGNIASGAEEAFAAEHRDGYAGPDQMPGPEGVKQRVGRLLAAFPDLYFTIEDMTAEGDWVVTRFTVRGTQRGELQGIPSTGKQVAFPWVSIARIAAGKIVESWSVFDGLGLIKQQPYLAANAVSRLRRK